MSIFFQILENILSLLITIMKPNQNLLIVSYLYDFSYVPEGSCADGAGQGPELSSESGQGHDPCTKAELGCDSV